MSGVRICGNGRLRSAEVKLTSFPFCLQMIVMAFKKEFISTFKSPLIYIHLPKEKVILKKAISVNTFIKTSV